MKRKLRSFSKSGFTLVELLVVIAIFTIITSIAVFSNSQFNSSVILSNLAYEVALSVRQAQSYGIDVKTPAACIGVTTGCGFNSGYGLDFNMATTTSYILFEDLTTPVSHEYLSQYPSELLQNFSVGKGFTIRKLAYLLNPPSGWTSITSGPLDISFVRPNPDAYIYFNGNLRQYEVEICIQDPTKTMYRAIQIEPTGQISVVTDASCNTLP